MIVRGNGIFIGVNRQRGVLVDQPCRPSRMYLVIKIYILVKLFARSLYAALKRGRYMYPIIENSELFQ